MAWLDQARQKWGFVETHMVGGAEVRRHRDCLDYSHADAGIGTHRRRIRETALSSSERPGPATVEAQETARDVGGGWRQQECRGLAELLRLPVPA